MLPKADNFKLFEREGNKPIEITTFAKTNTIYFFHSVSLVLANISNYIHIFSHNISQSIYVWHFMDNPYKTEFHPRGTPLLHGGARDPDEDIAEFSNRTFTSRFREHQQYSRGNISKLVATCSLGIRPKLLPIWVKNFGWNFSRL